MVERSELAARPYGQWWQSSEPMVDAPYEAVRNLGLAALKRAGASERDAAFLLSTGLDKAVQGDHARGIDGLPKMVRAALNGGVRLQSSMKILKETPATALVDGDPTSVRTLVCRDAMDLAIKKARQHGIGWVSVRFAAGILTQHVRQAVDAGMVGMVMTQTYPLVAPHGGYRPLLGNAPIALGVPARDRDPIILDMALTETSASGVKLSALQGERVPERFLLDEYGNPTTDPLDFPEAGHFTHDSQKARGSLVPLGGSHKAYGLIYMVSLLTSVLTNSNAPWDGGDIVGGQPAEESKRYGSVYMALDPTAFLPIEDFGWRVEEFVNGVKSSPRKEGVEEILYPGERSQRLKRQRREAGRFLLPVSHYKALVELGRELNLREQLPERVAGMTA